MKKIFKLIYPYSYLHSKWWHRLILVIIILGGLFLGLISTLGLANDSLSWKTYIYYAKVEGLGNDTFQVICKREENTYGGNCSPLGINVMIFDFLEKTSWANSHLITTENKTFNEFLGEKINLQSKMIQNIYLKGTVFTNEKELVISDLKTKGIIQTKFETDHNIGNIILSILGGVAILVGSFAIFFGAIYRTVLYIIYGSKLGKEN